MIHVGLVFCVFQVFRITSREKTGQVQQGTRSDGEGSINWTGRDAGEGSNARDVMGFTVGFNTMDMSLHEQKVGSTYTYITYMHRVEMHMYVLTRACMEAKVGME